MYSKPFISLSFRRVAASFMAASRSGFANGLEGLQQGEVLLEAPVDALLVEGEELELLRLHGEDAGGGEGVVDLGVRRFKNAAVFAEAEGEEVVLDGADPIQTPAVGGDALGELESPWRLRARGLS